jgi:hypothetical protein
MLLPIAVLCLASTAIGQRLNETDIYPGFRLKVIVPEAIVDRSEISDQIELVLRNSSIPIDPKSPEAIQFTVGARMSPDGSTYAVGVRLELFRVGVSLGSIMHCQTEKDQFACERGSLRYVSAWSQDEIIVSSKTRAAEAVKDIAKKLADSFVLFYLRETQKPQLLPDPASQEPLVQRTTILPITS